MNPRGPAARSHRPGPGLRRRPRPAAMSHSHGSGEARFPVREHASQRKLLVDATEHVVSVGRVVERLEEARPYAHGRAIRPNASISRKHRRVGLAPDVDAASPGSPPRPSRRGRHARRRRRPTAGEVIEGVRTEGIVLERAAAVRTMHRGDWRERWGDMGGHGDMGTCSESSTGARGKRRSRRAPPDRGVPDQPGTARRVAAREALAPPRARAATTPAAAAQVLDLRALSIARRTPAHGTIYSAPCRTASCSLRNCFVVIERALRQRGRARPRAGRAPGRAESGFR